MYFNFSEFCGHVNENVDVTDEEKPKADTVDYVLEPAPPAPADDGKDDAKDDVAEAKAAIKASTKGGLIIFAIDISRSMNRVVTIPALQGRKLAHTTLTMRLLQLSGVQLEVAVHDVLVVLIASKKL